MSLGDYYKIMKVPSALVLECPNCGMVPHRLLKGRISDKKDIVFEGLVRCSKCGYTRKEIVRERKPIPVPFVISWGATSQTDLIEMDPDFVMSVGDRFPFKEWELEITSIEKNGKRLNKCRASETGTVWAKRVDQVVVKFSLNKGARTTSHEIVAARDEEFFVDDMLEIGRHKAVIRKIKTKKGIIRRGKARAEEISRIYANIVRERLA